MVRCPSCGFEPVQGAVCTRCRASLRRHDDDGHLSAHSRGTLIGRVRPPTVEEKASAEAMFRPESVIELVGALPADLSAFEQHVAALVDGVRPVARLKKKSGLTSDDLRVALGLLRDRKLLALVGIVVEAIGPWADDIQAELAERTRGSEDHSIKGSGEYIPPHVMAEIQTMVDEEERAKLRDVLDDEDEFDDDTSEGPTPRR